MRKRTVVIIIIAALALAALLVPGRSMMKDGGSVAYTSLTYRITFLHRFKPLEEEQQPEIPEYITGTEVELFPWLSGGIQSIFTL